MNISQWLDRKESQGFDVSHAVLPTELEREEEPDETIFFKEIRPCSILCTGDHPFATVERFGRWYRSRGRERKKDLIPASRRGGFSPGTGTSPCRQPNPALKNKERQTAVHPGCRC